MPTALTSSLLPSTQPPILSVDGLRVELSGGEDIVSGVSFQVEAGEVVGLVGESGSGKTTVAAALLGHVRSGASVTAGRISLAGVELRFEGTPPKGIRGKQVSYVPQDPARALNPLVRIGKHLSETLTVHEPSLDSEARQARILDVLAQVGLPATTDFLRRFPHQLSGGQQQRVLLALAFVLRPKLVVLDEPTTALDVASQAKILETVRKLCGRFGVAALYVSHDLAVVSQLVDRVFVLYAGRIVEHAPRGELFGAARHPYTRALLAAVPDLRKRREPKPIPGLPAAPGKRPSGCAFAPRCARRQESCSVEAPGLTLLNSRHGVACLNPEPEAQAPSIAPAAISERRESGRPESLLVVNQLRAGYPNRRVLEGVSLEIGRSECLALVGESGCGKTTLARALAGIGEHSEGALLFEGQALPFEAARRSPAVRSGIQYVFQNPHRALNPRRSVGETLLDALRCFFPRHPNADARVDEVLTQVALLPAIRAAYPSSLSGGECQRVAIARALICEPKLIICDEVTSALDVSVQATILELLRSMQRNGLAVLFVTHDLGVVRTLADRVIVLHSGKVVETGLTDRVLDDPQHAYTRELLRHTPTLR